MINDAVGTAAQRVVGGEARIRNRGVLAAGMGGAVATALAVSYSLFALVVYPTSLGMIMKLNVLAVFSYAVLAGISAFTVIYAGVRMYLRVSHPTRVSRVARHVGVEPAEVAELLF